MGLIQPIYFAMAQASPPKPAVLWIARAITALVSLALMEGVLWLGGYPAWRTQQISPTGAMSQYQPDPELGWTNRAGSFDLAGSASGRFRYTNWTAGRRATAPQEPNADDARPRLAFVGDSYPYGYGLDDQDTFAWLVQERHPELEVANYGTPGYGTYQSFLTMKRVFAAGPVPEYVVYVLNGFHEFRNTADPTWIRVAKPSANGVFFPFAVLRNGGVEGRRTGGDIIWPISQRLRSAAMVEEYYERAESWKRVHDRRLVTQTLLIQMDQLARSSNAKFSVVLFDDLRRADREAYSQFLSSQGIAFNNCNPPELSEPGYRQPDGHPNAKMSQVLVDCVDPVPTVARTF